MPGFQQVWKLVRDAEEQAKSLGSPDLHRYATDPVSYVHEILKIPTLAPDQCAVLRAAVNPRARVLVPSGNELGKSFIEACLCSWHYDCFFPSLTIVTAPSKAQVSDIVFRELRRLRRGDPNFSPKADCLEESGDRVCKGYTASTGTSFQGRHDAHVMVLFDEAEGIRPEFWETTETMADRWICCYNPTLAASQTAVEERNGSWVVVPMSALNHPNVIRGVKGLPPEIPKAITLQKVQQRLAKWATKLGPDEPMVGSDFELAGVRYHPGPVAEARILGRRPSKPVDAVYEGELLDALYTRVGERKSTWPYQIGCDVARYGDDFTVFHVRQGTASIHHEAHNGWDVVAVADKLMALAARFGTTDSIHVPLVVDSVGVGSGVVDICRRAGFRAIAVNSSCPSDQPDDYHLLRTQLYYGFREQLRAGLVDFSRLSPESTHDIIEQLRAADYELRGKGLYYVRQKDVIKAKIGRSPDDADATLLAYYQFPDQFEIA